MRLEQFIDEETKRVRRFAEYWNAKHKENPQDFPMDLAEGQWDEMLMIFDDGAAAS